MKLTVCILLALLIAPAADAQSFRYWWKQHHILCMCIGNPPIIRGGN